MIVYYHGGGWVIADMNVYEDTPRLLLKQLVLWSYRSNIGMRPRNFSAQHQDAAAAYRWVLQNALGWGGDPKRVALAGERVQSR